MLFQPLADLAAGDQQHLFGARKCLAQRFRIAVVDLSGLDAPISQVRDFGQIPASGHNLPRRHVLLEEGFNNKASELSGGACDNDRHGGPFHQGDVLHR